MSDFEENDIELVLSDEEIEQEPTPKPERYKCKKAVDLRKQKSKANIMKALDARKKMFLKKKKERLEESLHEINQIELSDESESDDSGEDSTPPPSATTRLKSKPKTKKSDDFSSSFGTKRLEQIETMLESLNRQHQQIKKKKKRPSERKTIIQIQQPSKYGGNPNKTPDEDELINGIKRKLLLKL